MREILLEIWVSVRRNKLRTFMTGFSVAWGIFMLIILLGSGNGLKNGVMSNFSDRATNSMQMWAGNTSVAYKGHQTGRQIQFNLMDQATLATDNPQISSMAAIEVQNGQKIAYGREYIQANINGVTPAIAEIEGIKTLSGRFVNESDVAQRRKVVLIDEAASTILFKGADPVGSNILISGSSYTVIGVCKGRSWGNTQNLYIPITTLMAVYRGFDERVSSLAFTVDGINSKEQSNEFEQGVREQLAVVHEFSPTDNNAVWIRNRIRDFLDTMMIFNSISMFVWVIGIGTLMAGIVGVGNIMLVTVRERTFEFGIRKALGARPGSIIGLILLEATIITTIFGYVGMVLGVGLMELVNYVLNSMAANNPEQKFQVFINPTVELSTAITATIVLIVAGLIAGYIPARHAARIKTIDALRHNK